MKNKIILLFLSISGIYGCSNNQVASDVDDTSSIERSTIKTVKEYIDSNEFIDVVPTIDLNVPSTYSRSVQNKQMVDYQMKAAAYRFYKHCTQDEDGIITCNVGNGKDINISEEIFELRIKDMESCNEWIRKCKREGKNYKITRLDEKYFDQLLNYK